MRIHQPPEGPILKVNQVIEESRKGLPISKLISHVDILKVVECPKPPAGAQDLDYEHIQKLVLPAVLNVGVSHEVAKKNRELKLHLTKFLGRQSYTLDNSPRKQSIETPKFNLAYDEADRNKETAEMINIQIGDVDGKLESVTTKQYLEPPRNLLMFEGHRGPHAQRSN